jgi:hypothetical protein
LEVWVQGWIEQTLSSGGKEVLIKSIAQEIPVYSVACFNLNSQQVFVNKSTLSYEVCGGEVSRDKGNLIEFHGIHWLCLSIWKVWDFKILRYLF